MNESDLLDQLKNGDERALSDLVSLHQEAMIAYVYCLSGDLELSKDVCQESFLKLISKPPMIFTGKSLKSWLFRVARNQYMDHLRRHKISFSELEDKYDSGEQAPDSQIIGLQQKEKILMCLDELPQSLKETVELRIYEELNFREIAEKTGTPLGTVLWRMKKALKLLKPKFQGDRS
ncbi:RNA polymerase sigma-70 factor [Lentisphaera araneosa HTCC2155]|uniref:RNA polymerase sigma-70 factor n=1 Tax=Lentisphaera araneosa HTCC2155 TaxID=313628 RepID=A6DSK4_9BACT|nr:RNA polymerase sigma factor [Lentisphaera araneosa]EDM25357.1 RNA polymerase sigma-70 factor [Lentisphaera araneosa HTCC2155]